MTGFEPATPASQKQCSTKLSYIPLTMHLSVCYVGATPNILTVCNEHREGSHFSLTWVGVPILFPLGDVSQDGCQFLYVLIITLLMPPVKRFPVLPSIMMHCPHTKDRDKHKKKTHHSKTPWSLHGCSNEQLYVVHRSSSSPVLFMLLIVPFWFIERTRFLK